MSALSPIILQQERNEAFLEFLQENLRQLGPSKHISKRDDVWELWGRCFYKFYNEISFDQEGLRGVRAEDLRNKKTKNRKVSILFIFA